MTKQTASIPNPPCVDCSIEMVLRSRFNNRFGRKRYAGSYYRCLQCGQTKGVDVWQRECAERELEKSLSELPSLPANFNLDDFDFDFDLDDLVPPPPSAKPRVVDPLKTSQRSSVIVLATHPFWISRHRGRC